MEKAIKIAIENGYTMYGRTEHPLFKWWVDTSYKDFRVLIGYDYAERNANGDVKNSHDYIWIQAILLDPLFWQALGKGLGWWEDVQDGHCELCGDKMPEGEQMFRFHGYSVQCVSQPIERKEWRKECLRFINHHVFEGKDIESFFNELIK